MAREIERNARRFGGVEVDRLFGVARGLRDKGAGILFISHRFEEVFALCDRITVMRDGRDVGILEKDALTEKNLIALMTGEAQATLFA